MQNKCSRGRTITNDARHARKRTDLGRKLGLRLGILNFVEKLLEIGLMISACSPDGLNALNQCLFSCETVVAVQDQFKSVTVVRNEKIVHCGNPG